VLSTITRSGEQIFNTRNFLHRVQRESNRLELKSRERSHPGLRVLASRSNGLHRIRLEQGQRAADTVRPGEGSAHAMRHHTHIPRNASANPVRGADLLRNKPAGVMVA